MHRPPPKEKANIRERCKYIELFEDKEGKYRKTKDGRGYGAVNWGRNADHIILRLKPSSLCDVGTGNGQFCVWAAENGISKVWGLDIASVRTGKVIEHPGVTYIDSEARYIPLPDESVDLVTSFDALEHCLPKDIDTILSEFNRVAKVGFVLKIAYRQAAGKSLRGEKLHMTVRPQSWWIEKLSRYATVTIEGGVYLVCIKKSKS